ncbi:MAG: hypothetical protein NZ845_02075 [Thermodesulfovibrio sp.]|nr:hypothetical protein [Thermodesulfovibrio sp.]MCX7724609.1 hypothetical protein [Thermodesulfovibrio sp.]MDW7972930.1 hypothetical protein [Thermodesulfovibrio sp.]
MIRFEELQMRIMDAAKNYLDVYDMATLIEQYSLNKESRLSMTLPEIKPPYPISATVSFSYNAHQTSASILFDEDELEDDTENMVEVEVVISLPFVEGYSQLKEIFEEIVNEYPDLDIVLIRKEFLRKDLIEGEEYELVYSYMIGGDDLKDLQLYEEIFFELSNILRTIYEKTKFYIDMSWYKADEDDNL